MDGEEVMHIYSALFTLSDYSIQALASQIVTPQHNNLLRILLMNSITSLYMNIGQQLTSKVATKVVPRYNTILRYNKSFLKI